MKECLKQNKLLLGITLLFSVITSVAAVFIAIILQTVIDAAGRGDMAAFQKILIGSFVYLLLLGLAGYIYSLCSKVLIRNLTRTLRKRLFTGIFRRNYQDFSASNTADYISALTNDTKLVEENYILPLLLTIQNIVVFSVTLIVLLILSPLITAFLMGCMVLMFGVPSLFGKALQKKQNAVSERMSVFTAKLKDLLSGYEVIKSYHIIRHANAKFEQENNAVAEAKLDADKLFALNESISQVLAILTQFSVIFIAAYMVIIGNITMGTVLALVQLSAGFVGPVLAIMVNMPKIKGMKPVLNRLDNLADYEDETFTGTMEPTFSNCLEAEGLSFSYDQKHIVISDIELALEKNKKYAIVGNSGCGKSTLLKLLTGHYPGFEGRISYDGIDIKNLNVSRLSHMISIIHQKVFMFSGNIKENICLYENFNDKEIESALEMSGVNLFVNQKSEGLLSSIGENGSNLSGGQRQRIAVARALIQKTPILVLDEATSGIEMQTAYEIESKLLTMEDLTLITITHNMSQDLLSLYNQIIYMENGRIAEIGSLDELLARKKGFSRFFTHSVPAANI